MPENIATILSANPWIFLVAAIWTIPWKGVALWRAARNQSLAWFIVLLIINTLGILDIIYIFIFSKRKDAPQQVETQRTQIPEKNILDIEAAQADLDDTEEKS